MTFPDYCVWLLRMSNAMHFAGGIHYAKNINNAINILFISKLSFGAFVFYIKVISKQFLRK